MQIKTALKNCIWISVASALFSLAGCWVAVRLAWMPSIISVWFCLELLLIAFVASLVIWNIYDWRVSVVVILIAVSTAVCSFLNPLSNSAEGSQFVRFPAVLVIIAAVCFLTGLIKKKKAFFHIQKFSGIRTEHVFAAVVLIVGLIICFSLPIKYNNTWDDAEHYKSASQFSQSAFAALNGAEMDFLSGKDTVHESNAFNPYMTEVNTGLDILGPRSIAYVVFMPALVIGRTFNISFSATMIAGRICNLLFYLLIIALAIKKLKTGKIILAASAMIPTAVYQTCNWTYDGWIISLLFFSFAYYFSALQRTDEKLTPDDILIMLFTGWLACLPKAPYSFMLLAFLFMPKEKFTSAKQHRWYLAGVIAAAAIPYIYTFCSGLLLGDVGDVRGGDDVSAYGQISFILQNIPQYAGVLLNFVADWINPLNSYSYLTCFWTNSYSGGSFLLIALIAIALLDNSKGGYLHSKPYIRIWGIVVSVGIIMILPTMLYIIFTPVGSLTIHGCAPRYILPAFYPVLMFLFNDWFKRKN